MEFNILRVIVFFLILGELPTTARWLRYLIQRHPDYRGDSVVTERINNDLITECLTVSRGEPTKSSELLLRGLTSTRTRRCPSQATLTAETSLNQKRGEQGGRKASTNVAYASVGCSFDHMLD